MATKKTRILYIVEAMGGGVFSYLVDLTNELINDFEIYILHGVRKQTPNNYKEYFNEKIKLIKLDSFCRNIDIVNDYNSFTQIKKAVKIIHPDIVHLHSSKAGVLGRLALCNKDIPLFYTPHGYSFLMNNQSKIKRIIYKNIEIVCSRIPCTTISCSLGEHKETLKITKNALCVNNGINVDKLNELITNKTEKNSELKVFTLGRICHQKNPKLFNEIAKQMPKIKFIWIGDGELKTELTSSNIEITGWVDREKAIRYAQSCDVFILTSLWEGLPISLLEAMYMKKTCVVSNVIGNKDVIKNRVNGFVCNDLEQFKYALTEIFSNKVSFGEKAHSDVLKMYTTKIMSEKYKKIYLESVKER